MTILLITYLVRQIKSQRITIPVFREKMVQLAVRMGIF
jgi:hypothetical protein